MADEIGQLYVSYEARTTKLERALLKAQNDNKRALDRMQSDVKRFASRAETDMASAADRMGAALSRVQNAGGAFGLNTGLLGSLQQLAAMAKTVPGALA